MTDYSESGEVKDTAISTKQDSGLYVSAVALSSSKVFVAYCAKNTDNKYVLECLICTIKDNSISIGTVLTIVDNATTPLYNVISLVKLNENKVFIVHSAGSYNLYGTVCNISGTTITKGTSTQLSTTNTGKVISAVKLDEGKVFIAHSYGANYYLYGIVCTISGTSISSGTDTLLVTQNTDSSKGCSVIALSNNKVFVSHCHDNKYQLYGLACTINGTTITKGSDTQLSSANYSGYYTCSVALNEEKVFIVHSGDNTYTLKAIVCTISETTITKGTDTVLNSTSGTGKTISAVALNENKVQVIHGDSGNWLYLTLCNVNDTTISIVAGKNDVLLSSATNSGSAISATALSEKDIFIAHSGSSNYYLYGMVFGYLSNLAKTITSSIEEIGGIAITSGQAGEMVTTVRPDDMMRIKVNATVSTENFGDINWQDVILINRKVFDKENIMYSSTKTLAINGENITFRFGLYPYSNAYKGWQFGWNFSKELYYTANAKSNYYKYGVALTSKTFIADWWTGVNNTGEHLSATADVTILD